MGIESRTYLHLDQNEKPFEDCRYLNADQGKKQWFEEVST
ncbi:MAG: hypothetical protein QOI57_3165 [Rubrobacteraceae bacterium]|jgi:hypothetical protein|nr:hypothetical protein [Rubrobacteraceae bacterium]